MNGIDLVRKKKAAELYGFSLSFLDHELIGKRKIQTYKLNKCTFVSLSEIHNLIKKNKLHWRQGV